MKEVEVLMAGHTGDASSYGLVVVTVCSGFGAAVHVVGCAPALLPFVMLMHSQTCPS